CSIGGFRSSCRILSSALPPPLTHQPRCAFRMPRTRTTPGSPRVTRIPPASVTRSRVTGPLTFSVFSNVRSVCPSHRVRLSSDTATARIVRFIVLPSNLATFEAVQGSRQSDSGLGNGNGFRIAGVAFDPDGQRLRAGGNLRNPDIYLKQTHESRRQAGKGDVGRLAAYRRRHLRQIHLRERLQRRGGPRCEGGTHRPLPCQERTDDGGGRRALTRRVERAVLVHHQRMPRAEFEQPRRARLHGGVGAGDLRAAYADRNGR